MLRRSPVTGEIIGYWDDKIVKEFYKGNPDDYDFIFFFAAFNVPTVSRPEFPQEHIGAYYRPVSNSINGIGLPIYDISGVYGSSGRLKGFGFMGTLYYISHPLPTKPGSPPEDYSKIDVGGVTWHEIVHQWCCYVGDLFRRGKDNAKLEITDGEGHFYIGLESPTQTPADCCGTQWTSNGDGTFRIVPSTNGQEVRYHPIVLYLMGVLLESDYDKRYNVYDAGIPREESVLSGKAVFYKDVSVGDIITGIGKREDTNLKENTKKPK
ncbi:MAG: hypothetical protein AABX33_07940 [Nanoarchaeota archaeon]